MNFPLSEIVSWVLEPLASAMEGGGELVSGEDLKSNLDKLNEKNKDWKPAPISTEKVTDMPGAVVSETLPKLCDCVENGCDMMDPSDDYNLEQQDVDDDCDKVEKNDVPEDVTSDGDKDNISGLDEDLNRDLSESFPGPVTDFSSTRQSKSRNMKMKREKFNEARKTRNCRKQPILDVKMMSSLEVPNDLVQDRSIPMVIIGSDVASLYPNLRWGVGRGGGVPISNGLFHRV